MSSSLQQRWWCQLHRQHSPDARRTVVHMIWPSGTRRISDRCCRRFSPCFGYSHMDIIALSSCTCATLGLDLSIAGHQPRQCMCNSPHISCWYRLRSWYNHRERSILVHMMGYLCVGSSLQNCLSGSSCGPHIHLDTYPFWMRVLVLWREHLLGRERLLLL
jgi:hypothetical protein